MTVLAVYDCMLFFRAASRPERPSLLFQFVEDRTVTLCLGSDVLAEMYDVLTRSEHQERFPVMTPEVVDRWLSHWVSLSRWISQVPEEFIVVRDPKDSKYVNLALASKAPYLVTFDKDLLELADQTKTIGREFRSIYPSLEIMPPPVFLARVASSSEMP